MRSVGCLLDILFFPDISLNRRSSLPSLFPWLLPVMRRCTVLPFPVRLDLASPRRRLFQAYPPVNVSPLASCSLITHTHAGVSNLPFPPFLRGQRCECYRSLWSFSRLLTGTLSLDFFLLCSGFSGLLLFLRLSRVPPTPLFSPSVGRTAFSPPNNKNSRAGEAVLCFLAVFATRASLSVLQKFDPLSSGFLMRVPIGH